MSNELQSVTSLNSDKKVISLDLFRESKEMEPILETPISDEMEARWKKLNRVSSYQSEFSFEGYRSLEIRNQTIKVRGGITFGSPFRLVNSHSTCQQCLYSFEVDTYGRGCVHECGYCYAKAQLTVHGYWNNPIPVPADISDIREILYTVFETDKRSKWRNVLGQRIPLRIGSMSDSFMKVDPKYKVTLEFLKLLKHYEYPFVVFTRSDLVANDTYLKELNSRLCSVQFSISSINDRLNKLIEPGAPSSTKRLEAIQKLDRAGIHTTVRINPLFPIYPDGYFTDPNFSWDGEVPKFDFSSFDMIDKFAQYDVKSVLVGFGRFSRFALNNIHETTGVNLRPFYRFYDREKSARDFHYSDREVRHYYEEFKRRAVAKAMEFSTCYIGNGEEQFWRDQSLWDNKKDCCNIQGKVEAFKNSARDVPFEVRLKHTNSKGAVPSPRLHDLLEDNFRSSDQMPPLDL